MRDIGRRIVVQTHPEKKNPNILSEKLLMLKGLGVSLKVRAAV
jgi:hypothetical protein